MTEIRRIGVTALFIVSLFTFGCAAEARQNGNAQDFVLKNAENKSVSLESVLKSHKAVLVNFWATWCPPCREEIPGLIDLQKKYGGNDFTILGIDIGESGKKVTSFVDKIGINYPVLLDSEQSVAEMYHVVGIPTSYLISSDGKILGEYHSYSQELVSDVEKAIKQ